MIRLRKKSESAEVMTEALSVPPTAYSIWLSAVDLVSVAYDRLAAAGRYVADPPEAAAEELVAEAERHHGNLAGVILSVERWREVWLDRLAQIK